MFSYHQVKSRFVCIPNEIKPLFSLIENNQIDCLFREEQSQALLNGVYTAYDLKTMPSKLGVSIIYFSSLRDIPDSEDKFERAIQEYHVFSVDLDHEEKKHFCICSHPITDSYYIINQYNGNILLIGQDCIKKFFPERVQDQVLTIRKGFRKCKYCKCTHKSIEMLSGYCRNCLGNIKKGSIKRACLNCFCFKIGTTQPLWKKICVACYKTKDKLDLNLKQMSYPDFIVNYTNNSNNTQVKNAMTQMLLAPTMPPPNSPVLPLQTNPVQTNPVIQQDQIANLFSRMLTKTNHHHDDDDDLPVEDTENMEEVEHSTSSVMQPIIPDFLRKREENNNTNKICVGCNQSFYSDAKWKVRCIKCFKLSKNPAPNVMNI